MSIFLLIILVASLVGVILWRLWENRDPYWHRSTWDRVLIIIEKAAIVTAGNIKLYYEDKAAPIPHLAADKGIERVFRRIVCRYPATRSNHDIKMAVLVGEIAPESRIPCFRVAITSFSPYYNGEWDMMAGSSRKVHYILAAGQIIAWGQPYGDIIVVPSSSDETFIENIADHEFEHIALGYYDPVEYERTKYHAPGTGHPIIPECGSFAPDAPHPLIEAVQWKRSEHEDMSGVEGFARASEPYSCLFLTK